MYLLYQRAGKLARFGQPLSRYSSESFPFAVLLIGNELQAPFLLNESHRIIVGSPPWES
jgi:hypothetical protein